MGIKLPAYYKIYKNEEINLPGYLNYLGYNDDFLGLIKVHITSIPMEENLRKLVKDIHSTIQDDQGLIEVGKGKTDKGHKYIYSIVKTWFHEKGFQYFLCLNVFLDDNIYSVEGFFNEGEMTGIRECTIYAKEKIKGMEGWNKDPYDTKFNKGKLMNISEDKKYDELFPNHPLTMARVLIEFIKKYN